jgi:chromosome partitioning protein
MSAEIILVAASKGGPGKTAIAAALGAHVASLGEKVVLVDADPQRDVCP